MAATLAEIREEFKAKQDRLGEVFAQAGPDLDLTKVDLLEGDSRARRDQVKAMNDELAVLGKEVEELNSLDNMRAQNAMVLDGLNRPVSGMIHPGAPTGRMEEIKSLAQRVVESEVITGYNSSRKQSPSVDMAAPELFGQRNAVTTETSYAPQAVRIPLILPGALRRPVVADLIPDGRTDQIAIVFMEETTTTNAAAAVAEGGAKPESTLVFTERTSPVRKIATVLPVTDELINDVSAMRAYLEARMRLFLMLAEETSLLSGNGSPDLTGFLNTANTQTQAKGADPTPDAIYKAMVKIETTAFLPPDGIVIHPLDWQDIRLLRTADGIYIWGEPMDPGPERIWGLPAVVTTAMTQNTALVGAFQTASQTFRRADVTFAISSEHSDFFIRNQLMLRIEERLALVVYRPPAFCTVTGI